MRWSGRHDSGNKVSILQDWLMYKNLNEILDANCCFRELGNISGDKKTLSFEFNELKKTLQTL